MCDTTGVTSLSLRNPDLSPSGKEDSHNHHHHHHSHHHSTKPTKHGNNNSNNNNSNDVVSTAKQNQVGTVMLCGVPIVSLVMDGKERLCLAQISSTLLKDFSYNEIHNRRVALGITCVQCTPVQLEILRRAGAMPVTSRRCGMITRREAERLCQSFLGDHAPPQLPENFAFEVYHECGWGCRGSFVPSRYNSSRAKCIRCTYCQLFFSPNKFIFHSHRLPESRYVQPDAANFNSWRRHLKLCGDPPEDDMSSNTLSMDTAQIVHAWEDVRAMFNGGTRKRMLAAHSVHHHHRPEGHRRSHNNTGGKGSLSSNNTNSSNSTGSSQMNGSSRSATPQQQQQQLNRHAHNSHLHSSHNSIISTGFGSDSTNPNASQSSFLSVPTPLLSPSARLDTIWNPGLSSTNPARLGHNPSGNNPTLPHLPFHPLSIPWLRRPLFPFPHPFGPAAAACHLLADPTASGLLGPEKLSSLSAAVRQSHSAFKPVSRNAENLFSWLNNNNNNPLNSSGGILGVGTGVTGAMASSLPEDLSLNSTVNIDTSPESSRGGHPNHHQGHSSVSSTNEESNGPTGTNITSTGRGRSGGSNVSNNVTSSNNGRHQIQILSSAIKSTSDDEENVDIESTEVEEECSSTSSVWVNNNNNNINDGQQRKRSIDSFSGEDDKDGNESGEGGNSPKRKRLWDFDSSESIKKSNLEMSHTLKVIEDNALGASKD